MIADPKSLQPGNSGRHPLRGLVAAQAIGAFNDNAWKQIVILLGVASTQSEAVSQQKTAVAQIVLLLALILFNLPGGLLADRLSKRTVIIGLKCFEVVLMLVGAGLLFFFPGNELHVAGILALLGIQAALFGPSKYGILPEILPHEKLSEGNGILEMWSNLAIIAGIVGGGVIYSATKPSIWVGGLVLAGFSAVGLMLALKIPHVPAAGGNGNLVGNLKQAWAAVREDRILRLAIWGQVFIWSIAILIPPPVLTHAAKTLKLPEWESGLPLAALGIGIGVGSMIAGKLSASKVEYGLLPLGGIGLTIGTLAFGLIGPGFTGTMILMTFIGICAGLMFVPLNSLIQWRSPAERRGSVIALANLLASAGMLAGSFLALGLPSIGMSATGVFLAASAALAVGTAWTLWLVPDAFMRFLLIMMANTIYKLRIVGRENIPREGPALLTPNHVSFADGLFVIATTDRPIRFMVYASYFKQPILGRFLKVMKAIPISSAGGPRVILEAFREAGRALDHGEIVCIFPEGQITRTGSTLPFRRGMERIVKGRDVPIIPLHIDRATSSIFSPVSRRRIPERIPLPVTVSIGKPLPATMPPSEIRRAIQDLDQRAWEYRKEDRVPLHHTFISQARRHPFRLAFSDGLSGPVSCIKSLVGVIALARALRPIWKDQVNVGIMLPTSVVGCLVNLAATLSGRVVVNLNFTVGKASLSSVASQAGLKTLITSRAFIEKAQLELPEGVEIVCIEDVRPTIQRKDRAVALMLACLAPKRLIEKAVGAVRKVTVEDHLAIIFSSGSEGDPKGVVLTHLNLDANVEAIAQSFRIYPEDRILDVLPLFHSFGYLLLWLGVSKGMGLVCHVKPQEAGVIGVLVEQYRATVLFATPTFLHIYTKRCEPSQFGSIRLVVAGAEKLSDAVSKGFEEHFGIRPLEGYGVTECSPVIAVNMLDFRAPGFYQPGSRRGTVGHALPGVSIRIVSLDKILEPSGGSHDFDESLPPGTEGMVLVKGCNVMQGYLNRPDLTKQALREGWYVTGDLGMLDEDGFLKITGRLSRFSKIGGEMVPHGRVEDALNEAVGSQEPVFAVTAVPDGRDNERLAVLHTVPSEQIPGAIEKLREKGLPNLFIPRRDQFVEVEALPMLGTGKLDLRALKKMATEAFSNGGTRKRETETVSSA